MPLGGLQHYTIEPADLERTKDFYCDVLGLVPPGAGWAWQLPQLLELKAGPSPTPGSPGIVPLTESTCIKRAMPSAKNCNWAAVRPGSGLPASTPPARTPGSCAALWACTIHPTLADSASTATIVIGLQMCIVTPFLSRPKRAKTHPS